MSNVNKQVRVSGSREDYHEERNRILTMKYGKQQMMLIRKRIKIEMWLMETLETLSDTQASNEYDLDIDTLLDIDGGDMDRRKYCQDILKTCPAPRLQIEAFIDELLRRLREL